MGWLYRTVPQSDQDRERYHRFLRTRRRGAEPAAWPAVAAVPLPPAAMMPETTHLVAFLNVQVRLRGSLMHTLH